ncbi:aminotransferase class V-fold PLP-dependent enzyme [Ferroplasma sp.]|uniref:pyridoxal-phosphate-dependent aminotransferase family protein n=1 Tax=Ferroplasma sp. TaxID=2591003 RepID=UPI00261EB8A1|nr:aminotransferase class V-fold PLP-dependent enzyme [Ferroplasma sp.]
MKAPDYTPFILPGSGTIGMESITSLLKKGDNVLIISSGVFGDRWKSIFERYPVNYKLLRSAPGEIVNEDAIMEELEKKHYKMVTMTHVETSTGTRFPVKKIAEMIRNKTDIIVVDAVASAAAEELKVQDWGIDVCLTGSQKALASPPGAALLVLSPNAISHLSDNSVSGFYTNLNSWLKVMDNFENNKSGYFTTLPVHLIFSLEKSFELIKKETIEIRVQRHEMVASSIREGISKIGMEIMAKENCRSNTVTAMMLAGINMNDFLTYCIENGIEMATGIIPEFAGKYVRIGHMGWINENDAISTIAVIERALIKFGKPIDLGSGLNATQKYLVKFK